MLLEIELIIQARHKATHNTMKPIIKIFFVFIYDLRQLTFDLINLIQTCTQITTTILCCQTANFIRQVTYRSNYLRYSPV